MAFSCNVSVVSFCLEPFLSLSLTFLILRLTKITSQFLLMKDSFRKQTWKLGFQVCSLLLGCCCSQPSQLLNSLYFERLFICQHVASKLSSVWGFSFDFIYGYFAYEKIIAHIVTWFIFSFLFSWLLGFMSNSGVLHFSIITFLPIFFFFLAVS